MARKRITSAMVAGALMGMSALASAQTGSDAKDPGPPSSSLPTNNPPGLRDTVGEGQGTPQYVPGTNRGTADAIPGEGAGTPPEQHLHKNPRVLPKEVPPPAR